MSCDKSKFMSICMLWKQKASHDIFFSTRTAPIWTARMFELTGHELLHTNLNWGRLLDTWCIKLLNIIQGRLSLFPFIVQPHSDKPYRTTPKDMGGSQRDNGSSLNLSYNDLKQKEIEIKEGSTRVSWYETQLLIGQPNGGSPKLSKYPRG